MMAKLHLGDCLDVMKTMDSNSIDSIITDNPYGLHFMGAKWDYDFPSIEYWKEMYRIAKPGAILLSFGGTRVFHRVTCAIEDAGWEIKDCLMWLQGSGMPKGINIGNLIDKELGKTPKVVGSKLGLPGYTLAPDKEHSVYNWGTGKSDPVRECQITEPSSEEGQKFNGYNSTLKPAWEPIIFAMKAIDENYAINAMKWGVSGLNINECRIEYKSEEDKLSATPQGKCISKKKNIGAVPDIDGNAEKTEFNRSPLIGRWPTNVILDEEAAQILDEQSGTLTSGIGSVKKKSSAGYQRNAYGKESRPYGSEMICYGDSGGASRFFYVAKASPTDRQFGLPDDVKNNHPTVKPIALMEYLCKLTKTPTGGIVLDPFCGSGTTGIAAINTGRPFIGIEKDAHYYNIAEQRIKFAIKLKTNSHKDIFET